MNPGDIVAGRYRVERMLGKGGMGEVYVAEHIGIGRRVALKMLNGEFAHDEPSVSRLEREARATAAIQHVNIVEVFDFGLHDDLPFIAMELLSGESLGDRMSAARKLDVSEACFIMGQILSALSAAHKAGIMHRDLKPDNVMLVRRDNRDDVVKLLDFGISKFLTTSMLQQITLEGIVIGTPHYISPEQAMARPDVDGRTDLWAAGVMLYEMLTGELPFDDENPTKILLKICGRDEDPRWPREIDPNIPEALDAIVRRALAPALEYRFQTAEELLEALRPFGAEPIYVGQEGITRTSRVRDASEAPPHVVLSSTPGSDESSSEPTGLEMTIAAPTTSPRAAARLPRIPRIAYVIAIAACVATVIASVGATRRQAGAAPPQHAAVVAPRPASPLPTTRIENAIDDPQPLPDAIVPQSPVVATVTHRATINQPPATNVAPIAVPRHDHRPRGALVPAIREY